jgi:hypothetical protein
MADGADVRQSGAWLTLDVWAVLLAFVLALLVWSGVLKNIPW